MVILSIAHKAALAQESVVLVQCRVQEGQHVSVHVISFAPDAFLAAYLRDMSLGLLRKCFNGERGVWGGAAPPPPPV